MALYVPDRVEKIVGKGENAGYQHFLVFQLCFQKASFPELLKLCIIWKRDKVLYILKASHRCPLFQQWLCGKAASGLEGILCRVLVKRNPRKHG